jgi:cytochrome c-type biogenesis protein CcmH
MKLRALLAALAGVLCMAAAADPADRLPDPAQEARAKALFSNVRCLVCQNESIDDSEAELAADLRKLIREQVREGRTNEQIKQYLVDRYGQFVLMTPSLSPGNIALWAGPFVVVLLGAGLLIGRLRNRSQDEELSPDEAERLKGLSETDPA